MSTGTIVCETTTPIPVERLWRASICDMRNLLPKLLPQLVRSMDILEGDGGVGTITQYNLTDAVEEFGYVKDRIELIDHEKHIFKYSVMEGGLVGVKLKSFAAEITFNSSAEGGLLGQVKYPRVIGRERTVSRRCYKHKGREYDNDENCRGIPSGESGCLCMRSKYLETTMASDSP